MFDNFFSRSADKSDCKNKNYIKDKTALVKIQVILTESATMPIQSISCAVHGMLLCVVPLLATCFLIWPRTWFKCRENKQFRFKKSVFRAKSVSYCHTILEKPKLNFFLQNLHFHNIFNNNKKNRLFFLNTQGVLKIFVVHNFSCFFKNYL